MDAATRSFVELPHHVGAALDAELGWRVLSVLLLPETYSTVVTRAYFAGYDPGSVTLDPWQKRSA